MTDVFTNPIIGITMGDTNGIGAEIIVKALADEAIRSCGDFVIFGTDAHLTNAANILGIERFWVSIRADKIDYQAVKGVVVADYNAHSVSLDCNHPDIDSGRASLRFCCDAIDAAIDGKISAIVTAPINKISWQLAGARWPGHTELLAEKCDTDRKAMMFVAEKLKLALATIHEPFSEIINKLTVEKITESIELLNSTLIDYFGLASPLIAVAALNPHAGEQGRFGDEEQRIILPAIEICREKGIDAKGPYPADTMFLSASKGQFDGAVAMYHDQGMIPVKLLSFEKAVNVTIGLPIIRTSPAHGTAFDIAGKGIADAASMKEAIKLAAKMAYIKAQR